MNAFPSEFISAGLFFLFIFLFGFWLKRAGKPYNAILFNIHKLVGLGALVFLGITINRINQATPLSALEMTACAVTGLLFICTIVSGGLVSIDKPMPSAITMMHKLFPYLTVLSTAATLYLVLGGGA